MSAPAKILDGRALADAIWLLETRALVRAFLNYEYQFEHLADAVDPLPEFAEQSGLVAAIGQDEVQRLVSAPFERFRAIVAEETAAETTPELPSDYAAQLVMGWELDDRRDRWRWTGDLPPVQQPAVIEKRPYLTAQSTIDAFHFVLSLGDPERLAAWLRQHPDDAPALFKSVEAA